MAPLRLVGATSGEVGRTVIEECSLKSRGKRARKWEAQRDRTGTRKKKRQLS